MSRYLIDNDGEETRVDLDGLRRLARRNGILDTYIMDGDDLSDCIMDCYPDVTITTEED